MSHKKLVYRSVGISEKEFLLLGKYLDMVMNAQLAQAAMGREAGLVIGSIVDEAPGFARLYLSSKASRLWLRNNEDWVRMFSSEFYSALLAEIERNPVATEMPQLKGFDAK